MAVAASGGGDSEGRDAGAAGADDDIAALAKGGRTNIIGFLLRLAARIPFLLVAGRAYGPDALGRFAYAILVVEFAAQIATLGLKRGLAFQLSRADRPHSHIVADALLVGMIGSAVLAAILIAVPEAMFPNSGINGLDRLLPLIIFAIAGSDIALAACAYKFDIAATVRARAIVEPWTISIAACLLVFYSQRDGLILSYVASMIAAFVVSVWPLARHYGWPQGWRLRPGKLSKIAWTNLPLAVADGVEWGSRRFDVAILGLFATPYVVGIYYAAQQVASLPQKLKTSFEPVLGPVITRNVAENNHAAIANQVSQVGFWILAAQLGVALTLAIPGEAVMGIPGPNFVGGTGALAFLLAAEVLASPAVVSEAALVYIARMRNLVISLGMIALQAALSFGFILGYQSLTIRRPDLAHAFGDPDLILAACPAAALALALGTGALVKSMFLSRLLGHKVRTWRWALIWAGVAGGLVGSLVTVVPPRFEWTEIVILAPAILGVYAFVVWRLGFGPEDRALFRKAQPA